MNDWTRALRTNPIPALLAIPDPALAYHVRCDLLDEPVPPPQTLWELKPAAQLVKKQAPGGFWSPGAGADPEAGCDYRLVETFRQLRLLVACFAFDRCHPVIARAAEFLFSRQTAEGDIRGILGNQTMPYYHGAILELLVKAGYGEDPRLIRGLEWLLSVRQADGAWLVPAQAVDPQQKTAVFWLGETLKPSPDWPSSHLATGMALRAFVTHPCYCRRPEITAAAGWLKGRFFRPDSYNDRQSPEYWLKFQFPYWWPNLLTALDSLAGLGFSADDPQVGCGLGWFLENQAPDGLWDTGYGKGKQAAASRPWVGLAVCRVLRRFLA